MIIDSHVHVGIWNHADFLGRSNSLEETLRVLKSSGIDGAAMTPSDQCENLGLLLQMKAAAPSFPGPLWFFAWVRPAAEGHPGEDDLNMVRANRSSICGLKLHPSLSRIPATDASFRPALELAAELDLRILLHCGRWAEIAGYRHGIELAERYPGVKFVFAHAGGDTPPNAIGAAKAVHDKRLENVWFEFSGLREHWVVERNVAMIGAERYMMGSDFPLAHPLMYMGAVRGMALTEEEKRLILGENARRLLGPPLAQ